LASGGQLLYIGQQLNVRLGTAEVERGFIDFVPAA